ncbi:Sau3AI family type II restriction endonuclease [Campylobacter geochelonis]|uniref:Type-2 restriction enzyme Sau3AI n=1 Tax=Campylobacter geochelonis TaxID=1780362 RepID=A0A128EGB1_9BACT|nr:Sau3AI family type II restriction endonuclease [Campylobacter geochelonis]QKF71830.1 DNA mismatch repair protein MutH [Campylobacter geochelonis]CZE47442.1 Type-2 restriction enzyme Sau3AI [Campylobacter geochelonis]
MNKINMGIEFPYDKTKPKSIEKYAKNLIGKTFRDVLKSNFTDNKLIQQIAYFNNPKSKGSLGNLLEEFYFLYKPNSDSSADFPEAGVELKVTPYEITSNRKIRAGERLVITMIPNNKPIDKNFKKSHLIDKLKLILFVLYLRNKKLQRIDYKINYVNLFNILSKKCKDDLEIIIDDYKKIVSKIQSGLAHKLSESDTQYLGACTKGASAARSLQNQFYNDKVKAKRRAFSLKQSYMTYIINHYILNNVETFDSIFHSNELKNTSFESAIINKISNFIDKSEDELYSKFEITRSKRANNSLIMTILGVKTDNAKEFEKANIQIKTIRVKKNGEPREHMSFPTFKILEFIAEDFEASKLYNIFSQTKFLFVIFQEKEDGLYYLNGAKFWNMPIVQLEKSGKKEWKMYQNKFKNGIKFNIRCCENSIIIDNDLPTASNTNIFHVRLHSTNTAYVINGTKYGRGKESDMDILPNGDKMTKQCFWLNKSYIKKQIKELIL